MINENDTVEEAAKKVSDETDSQIMSNSVMALRQCIEDRLKKSGDVNSIFKKKVKDLYGDDVESDSSHKAYVRLEYDYTQKIKSYARIYPIIDKVVAVGKGEKFSYALHLYIISNGKRAFSPPYENGFIFENCGRFAVGHDIGHTVMNLGELINAATIGVGNVQNVTSNASKECEADFFSYIQSDLRDFDLLKLNGHLDLDKVFENYKPKVKEK